MDVWVIGAGGLLGSAVHRAARSSAELRLFPARPIPWASTRESVLHLRGDLARFHAWRRPGQPWTIIWAAGSGVIASTTALLSTESETLLSFSREVAATAQEHGAFVFSSSASVFGDRGNAVSDETSTTFPMNAYAQTKLDQEGHLASIMEGRLALVVARISTLYGPGQDLTKGQGLVSTMCREVISQRAISVFVPLDTQRDFLFTDDAARRILALAAAAATVSSSRPTVRVVGSYRSTTIGEVARTVQIVARRRTHILQIQTPSRSLHVRRQLLTSRDPELTAGSVTPLLLGISAVYRDVLQKFISQC